MADGPLGRRKLAHQEGDDWGETDLLALPGEGHGGGGDAGGDVNWVSGDGGLVSFDVGSGATTLTSIGDGDTCFHSVSCVGRRTMRFRHTVEEGTVWLGVCSKAFRPERPDFKRACVAVSLRDGSLKGSGHHAAFGAKSKDFVEIDHDRVVALQFFQGRLAFQSVLVDVEESSGGGGGGGGGGGSPIPGRVSSSVQSAALQEFDAVEGITAAADSLHWTVVLSEGATIDGLVMDGAAELWA